jgi:hypothetical protein
VSMPYGICPNAENRCEFSYGSRNLAQLHHLLQSIQARESLGRPAGDVGTLKVFAGYFQPGIVCRACGESLCIALLPITGLDSKAEEYEKRIRLNHLLTLAGELQARGVLGA